MTVAPMPAGHRLTESLADATVTAQKIISCVARVGERFGVRHVCEVLRGAKTDGIQRQGHDRLSTFDLLANVDQRAAENLVHQLLDQELLGRTGGYRPVVTLSERSWEVLRGQREVVLLEPRVVKAKTTKADVDDWQGVDRDLFERLRRWRRRVTEARGKPAWTIFDDKSLRSIARDKPAPPRPPCSAAAASARSDLPTSARRSSTSSPVASPSRLDSGSWTPSRSAACRNGRRGNRRTLEEPWAAAAHSDETFAVPEPGHRHVVHTPQPSSMRHPTHALHALGQSLWLDNITRGMLDDGTLARYVSDLAVTGLTSNPAIYNLAFKNTPFYDAAVAAGAKGGVTGERLFFDLAIEDLRRAADLFRPIHDRTGGLDGWVSLEVSPRLANFGTLPQRLLMASTGTKDPALCDHLYVRELAAPHTINTMPEATLLAFADHGTLGGPLSSGGGTAERTLFEVSRAGIDLAALGGELQRQGAEAFVKSWHELLQIIDAKANLHS